ncbi:hypothetical protein BD769DRAFT_1390349 [Suillus cothurnatus]|nr:hypothetical protein BD769DRAFT_1390349 [Suillus cothurnatus]
MSRTGVKGFYVAIYGDAKSCIKEITHLDPKHFALKFELWMIGDFVYVEPIFRRVSTKINMNYDNYESKIVKKHRIILEGFCLWVKLRVHDLEQHMERNCEHAKNDYKKKPAGAAKSAAVIKDNNSSQDKSEEEDEVETQHIVHKSWASSMSKY